MNNKWLLWVLLTAGLSGCSLTDSDSVSSRNRVSNVLITEPLLADYKSELAIAKLSQLINHSKLSKNNLAQLYYDRGVIYDSLGLRALSQLDFRRALELKPAYADAYNFIGIQLSLTGQYAQAFEAFDSALEINPEHSYVYLNRGIAFYYYGRAELSKTDLETFYRENSTDPYRAIWLYLSEFEIDPKLAKERLLSHATLLNKFDWPYQIVSLFLQEVSESDFIETMSENVRSPRDFANRLCEGYFYLAKLKLMNGEIEQAKNYFRLSLSTNVFEFVEHKYSRVELYNIALKYQNLGGKA